MILEDDAAGFGPAQDTHPVCLECQSRVAADDGHFECPDCGLPLCSEACYEVRDRHRAECEILSRTPNGHRMKIQFNREQ